MLETLPESPAAEKRQLSEYELHDGEKASSPRSSTTTKRKLSEEQLRQLCLKSAWKKGVPKKRKATPRVQENINQMYAQWLQEMTEKQKQTHALEKESGEQLQTSVDGGKYALLFGKWSSIKVPHTS